jgi:hypothetical protein
MFQPGSEDTRKLLGDATDCGLLRYCDRLVPSSLVRMAYKKVSRVVQLSNAQHLLLPLKQHC